LRELNKAYVGFVSDNLDVDSAEKRKDIATGKWGCGVFGGDPQLKFMIQWLSASRAGRKMKFYCFGDKKYGTAEKFIKLYQGKTVGALA